MNLLGKLSWNAIPFDQPIVMAATAGMIAAIVLVLGWVTFKGYVPYLWREWITSVDHKRIGVMYIVLALIMLLRGFADAIMMRSQQALAAGGAEFGRGHLRFPKGCILPPSQSGIKFNADAADSTVCQSFQRQGSQCLTMAQGGANCRLSRAHGSHPPRR
jgi:hypothetical protein